MSDGFYVATATSDTTGVLTLSGRTRTVHAESLDATVAEMLSLAVDHAAELEEELAVLVRAPGAPDVTLRLDRFGVAAVDSAPVGVEAPAAPAAAEAETASYTFGLPGLGRGALAKRNGAKEIDEERRRPSTLGAAWARVRGYAKSAPTPVRVIAPILAVLVVAELVAAAHAHSGHAPTSTTSHHSPTVAVSTSPAAPSPTAPAAPVTTAPAAAVLAVKATSHSGGPLVLQLSGTQIGAPLRLVVQLHESSLDGRLVTTRTVQLGPSNAQTRLVLHAATGGTYAWQVTAPDAVPAVAAVTGQASVAAAPPSPSTTTGTSTVRPHRSTSTSTTSTTSTQHHAPAKKPTHHKTSPPKITISVPPSPIDRASAP